MGTKDVGLRVDDWLGINRKVSSEDVQDQYAYTLQNLYERIMGEIEPRGGAQDIASLPSTVTKLTTCAIVKDSVVGAYKLFKAHCGNADATAITDASVTMSFVTDVANGGWGYSTAAHYANSFIGTTGIQLVAKGPGIFNEFNSKYTTSLPTSGTTKRLDIVIASALANTNIRCLEVYAEVIYAYAGGVAQKDYIFIGSIDLVATPTGTFSFYDGPMTLGADPGAAAKTIGGTAPTVFATGANGGNLAQGTWYVAVLPQYFQYRPASVFSNGWYLQANATAVTLQAGQSQINVSVTNGADNACNLIAIGRHPHMMIPIGIASIDASYNYTIQDLPSPAVGGVNCVNGPSSTWYEFNKSAHSRSTHFIKYENSVWQPLFFNGVLSQSASKPTSGQTTGTGVWTTSESTLAGLTSPETDGTALWSWDNYTNRGQPIVFMTPNEKHNITNYLGQTTLFQTDGRSINKFVKDLNGMTPPTASVVRTFKEAIVLVDAAGSFCYFSRTTEPYNFCVPGTTTVLQYFAVEGDGGKINSLGTYTNTTTDSGPTSQLIIGKLRGLYITSDLPTYTSTSYNNASINKLSGKIGPVNNNVFAQTDIGTIFASYENVWLVRESGEPVPLGEGISEILRPSDPAYSPELKYWNAVFHEGHYKLAFTQASSGFANQELWLNIKKMKELQGKPCWYGPHTGRIITHSVVVEPLTTASSPEERLIVDGTTSALHAAIGDKKTLRQDYSTDITCIIETRNFPLGEPDTNKLHTKELINIKAEADFTLSETTTVLNDAGEETETVNRAIEKVATHTSLGTFAGFISPTCRAKRHEFYPTARLRGETIKKKWTYTGQVFFAISGYTIFYRQEGRGFN